MKNLIIVLLLICAAGIGALAVHQKSRLSKLAIEMEQLRAELSQAQLALAQRPEPEVEDTLAEQKARILQETLKLTTEASARQAEELARLEKSLATVQTNAGGFAEVFSKPEMRDMVKQQQKAVLGPMLAKSYSPFVQSLNMSPEQARQFQELLMEKMLIATDAGMSMIDPSLDQEKKKELAQQVQSETAAFDEKIREFLGDEQFKAYQEYEKEIPDRTSVEQFRDQLASTAQQLNASQEAELIRIMNQERTGFQWSVNFDASNPGDPNFAAMFTEDRLNQRAQEQAKLDGQIVDRARQILLPEQVVALEKHLTAQREMQMASMRMAGIMFGSPAQPK